MRRSLRNGKKYPLEGKKYLDPALFIVSFNLELLKELIFVVFEKAVSRKRVICHHKWLCGTPQVIFLDFNFFLFDERISFCRILKRKLLLNTTQLNSKKSHHLTFARLPTLSSCSQEREKERDEIFILKRWFIETVT